jgi:hypothetical protein
MLDAGWNEVEIPSLAGIKKREQFLISSSISPRRRLYEPEARDKHPVSRVNKQQLLTIPKT